MAPAYNPVKDRPHKAVAYVAANEKPTKFYGGCLDGDFRSETLRDTEDAARADVDAHLEELQT